MFETILPSSENAYLVFPVAQNRYFWKIKSDSFVSLFFDCHANVCLLCISYPYLFKSRIKEVKNGVKWTNCWFIVREFCVSLNSLSPPFSRFHCLCLLFYCVYCRLYTPRQRSLTFNLFTFQRRCIFSIAWSEHFSFYSSSVPFVFKYKHKRNMWLFYLRFLVLET